MPVNGFRRRSSGVEHVLVNGVVIVLYVNCVQVTYKVAIKLVSWASGRRANIEVECGWHGGMDIK